MLIEAVNAVNRLSTRRRHKCVERRTRHTDHELSTPTIRLPRPPGEDGTPQSISGTTLRIVFVLAAVCIVIVFLSGFMDGSL